MSHLWPAVVPPITADEAVVAARKLWRFAMGETWRGPVKVTSGRKHTWERDGTLYVNPNSWRWMVSDLAWLFFTRANPGARRSSLDVLKLEDKLIKQVIRRGWLANNLKKQELPPDVKVLFKHIEKAKRERRQVEDGVKRWTTKLNRAQTMLTKYERKLKQYNRKENT